MKCGTSEVGACSAMVSMFFYRNVRNERNDVGRTKLASRAALEARPGEVGACSAVDRQAFRIRSAKAANSSFVIFTFGLEKSMS